MDQYANGPQLPFTGSPDVLLVLVVGVVILLAGIVMWRANRA